MRNIVICCDGTANEFAFDRTNVLKLCGVLRQDEAQIVYYQPGLGTMEPPGALTQVARRVTRLLGRAIGYGLADDVRDAYTFLMNNHRPGDRVFLFGYSRGAYTVRAVAALVRMYGLLPAGNDPLVPYAIRLLMGVNDADADADPERSPFRLADEFRATLVQRPCSIHFLGVWDTVASVGWISNPLRLPYTASNVIVRTARHAVAIDERRAFFRTNLLKRLPERLAARQDLKQVWFAGVHGDVGGGYPEKDSGLSKLALQWMVEEATAHGLAVDPDRLDKALGVTDTNQARPDPDAGMHRSLRRLWWLAEIVPKKSFATGRWRINLARRRDMGRAPLVHWSAFARKGYAEGLPKDAVMVGAPPEEVR